MSYSRETPLEECMAPGNRNRTGVPTFFESIIGTGTAVTGTVMTRGVKKRFLYVLHQGVCKNAEPQDSFSGTLSLGIPKPPGYVQGQCQEKAKAEG